MSILTTAEAKVLLQLATTDATRDAAIAALIPPIQSFIFEHCNNHFEIKGSPTYDLINKQSSGKIFFLAASTISFDSSSRKISDSNSGFVSAGLMEGAHARVQGSILNDGVYKIETLAAGDITIPSTESLITEAAGALVTVSLVVFPQALKLAMAKLIAYELNKDVNSGKQSESLGDWSASFTGDYPESLLKTLNPFKKVRF